MYLLGYDIGTSSIKASLIHADSGKLVAATSSPKIELSISSPHPGFAEQDPMTWWENVISATKEILAMARISKEDIKAIGISYQMHGLVAVDKNMQVLRPAIIWCDSRAVEIGDQAFEDIGEEKCLQHLMNSPGNFTASKLKWVKEHQPQIYEQIYKIMLPGDFIAMKLTGKINTTVTGLSEGMLWDYSTENIAGILLDHYGIDCEILPELVPVFSIQGSLSPEAAQSLGLSEKTVVSYRAGDQPNNAFSLNVMHPGEVAATAGTSGVIYGVTDKALHDESSRANTFVHVNHTAKEKRYGVLLCINGAGISNRWMKNELGGNAHFDYEEMNKLASSVPAGAEGLQFFPFGNGAERTLANSNTGAFLHGLSFNTHSRSHLLRSVQEGIVFSMNYGLDIMKGMGMNPEIIKVGQGNMFLSPLFRDCFAAVTGCQVHLYNTDGAQGAARGAGIGAGVYQNDAEAFHTLKPLQVIEPSSNLTAQYKEIYQQWMNTLNKNINIQSNQSKTVTL